MVIWWLWRNDVIFRNGSISINSKLSFVRSNWKEVEDAFCIANPLKEQNGMPLMSVQWKVPPLGYWKLNTDGEVRSPYRGAGCEGLLRDENGI